MTVFNRASFRRGSGLALCAAIALPSNAMAMAPSDGQPGRLPVTGIPRSYQVELHPDVTKGIFSGSEAVHFELDAPMRKLVLAQAGLRISQGRIDGAPVSSVATDDTTETLTVTLPRSLTAGAHVLQLSFAGKLSDSAHGLFLRRFQANGHPAVMLASNFEPADARRMLPLWDEPSYRAKFSLGVDVPHAWTAVSNMPITQRQSVGDGLDHVEFAETPPMPSYLLALCAGEMDALEDRVDGVDLRVLTPKGEGDRGRYALGAAKQLLPWYDRYFGIRFPLPKLDIVTIPGDLGYSAAMENWGAITAREDDLLTDPKEDADALGQRIFRVVAHEMAHQWLGDLVTERWWDDLWMSEGFARWMEIKATDHFNPSWHVREFNQHLLDSALFEDAEPTTHAIERPMSAAPSGPIATDTLTYNKAASVLTMLERFLGPDAFRDDLRRYLRAHAYGNVTPQDLWQALDGSPRADIARIGHAWITQTGYPDVSASLARRDGRDVLRLVQSRAIGFGTATQSVVWPIPLRFSIDGQQFHVLFDHRAADVVLPGTMGPIVVNSGADGFYRVKYGDSLWKRLRQNFSGLARADRARLLMDTCVLSLEGQTSATRALGLFGLVARDADANAEDYWLVLPTLSAFDTVERGRANQTKFHEQMLTVLEPLAKRLEASSGTWGESERQVIQQLLQNLQLAFGAPQAITRERAEYAAILHHQKTLHFGDVLGITAFSTVGRYATPSDYAELLALANDRKDPGVAFLAKQGLAAVSDPALARRTLQLTLSRQYREPLMLSQLAACHPMLTRRFFEQHLASYMNQQSSQQKLALLWRVYGASADDDGARRFERTAHQVLPKSAWADAAGYAALMRQNAVRRAVLVNGIDAWMREESALLTK